MSLMRNPKKTVITVAIVVLLALLAYGTSCHGEEVVFSGGTAVARGQTEAIDLSWRLPSKVTDAYLQTSLTLVGDSEYQGYQANQAAVQVLYVDGFGPVDIGIGVALLQNVDRYNGSHGNFALQLGYNFRLFDVDLYVQYRHWSNAGTVKPNLGRDLLFIGHRF
jgi:hypothetical protein